MKSFKDAIDPILTFLSLVAVFLACFSVVCMLFVSGHIFSGILLAFFMLYAARSIRDWAMS